VLPPDEQLLKSFFTAARLHDTTRLTAIATVDFNPRTRGVVERFRISGRGDAPDGGRYLEILARVRGPAGPASERPFRVTLRRVDGRWVVTDVGGM
jgi:hypothetical protein